ncbi:glucose-methanol-choline oxidoreductase [Beutenbergia cavernae DSM 12333]|uniref:Glucose-methanol-choline oxidoreductase n=1 Tax=Beutenbergia cavernae (strain ATCC BAA-8 / DSM 12333 / CCUG 43141 / JCM 11478 / NBRC 16432 / NCIMB 13614 / HKI 0122) TaxID=471853 RepID=C5C1K3_BEUC1|nr:GMC family oxidoreductase [Beutenbergia cavernae]ACQ81613.1 glucose-methanol-choline oxidoreductase [Beutenbergia cavernae DSM 12333]
MNEPSAGAAHRTALDAIADAVVPGDDAHPSATRSGSAAYLATLVRERPDWSPRIDAAVRAVESQGAGAPLADLAAAELTPLVDAAAAQDADAAWLVRLVAAGYYAAGGGGMAASDAWAQVDWEPGPPGGWPDPLPAPPVPPEAFASPADLAPRYDVVVVGSGAGGGVAAYVLAAAGRRVLVVEAGEAPSASAIAHDHLRNPRIGLGFASLADLPSAGRPRTLERSGDVMTLLPHDAGWGNNASTFGGGTRVYGAQAWRFCPEDLAMASTYGVPDGSALADWPLTYDDLEPYYTRVEWELGVSGVAGDPWIRERSRPYPMPPLSDTRSAAVLAAGARALGWGTLAVPLLANSVPYAGRSACLRCAQCVGFACPVEARAGTHNTVLPRALATGRTTLLAGTAVERLVTNGAGAVVGVALVGADDDGAVWRREVAAGEVVLAAGATETARLLLASTSDVEPDGVGNGADQVGRHLQGHVYAGALGVFDDEVVDLVGPGPAIATTDFRHGNAGFVGGGMIANEFVPTPATTYTHLVDAGLLPATGPRAARGMRELFRRVQRVVGPVQEVTSASSRVRLDPDVRDRFGNAVVRLAGTVHDEDRRMHDELTARAAAWLEASGAAAVVPNRPMRAGGGPSTGQHQAGTCRMGDDPARSVVDPTGRVWGHANVRVVDASTHVTNGGVNPVLTVLANAWRVSEDMAS